jgi:MFS family permease
VAETIWLYRAVDPHGRLLTKPFVLAVLATLGAFLTIGMLLPVLPVYAKGPLGSGSIGVGLAVGAASPTALLFQPLAGRLGDRRGRRILVISGPLVMAASVAAYTLTDDLSTLVLLRLVSGVGEALVFVGAATVINDLAPEARRGEAVSLYSLGVWGGLAIGPLLGEAVLGDDRYDAVWLTAAACALLAAVAGFTLPETRPPAAVEARSSARLLHPAAVGPGLVLVASVFGFAGFNAFVALYARELGLDGAGTVFFLYSALVITIRVLGRRLPDQLGAKRASAMALALLAAGLLTIGLWNEPTGLYVGTAVFAMGTALVFPSLMTLAVSGTAEAERSSVVGTFTACADVGFALGALSLGGVASFAGYNGVFIVSAFSSVLGALLLARIPSPLRIQPAEA